MTDQNEKRAETLRRIGDEYVDDMTESAFDSALQKAYDAASGDNAERVRVLEAQLAKTSAASAERNLRRIEAESALAKARVTIERVRCLAETGKATTHPASVCNAILEAVHGYDSPEVERESPKREVP